MLRIAGIEQESITDGQGLRYTIFTQGCVHNCKGCHNKETHSLTGGYFKNIDGIVREVVDNPMIDGITLSGGDPFLQVDACIALIKKLKKEVSDLNVWAYSGYTYEELLNNEEKIRLLNEIDVLVDGRYDCNKRSLTTKFRGSTNQRIIDVKQSLDKNKIIEKTL